MGSYAVDHADALADVAEAGASVSFTRTTGQTVSDSTDVATGGTVVTVTGYAIEAENKSTGARQGETGGYVFRTSGLVHQTALELFFVPSTYGDLPLVDDTLTWNGADMSVKQVVPINPDGRGAIAATVSVSA